MSEPSHHRLCEEDLAFVGKIGAGVSHDMRNVLSIIGENAGLLDDQLALAERGKPLDHERLKKLSSRIARQVSRGTQTMEQFSRFAHAADEQTAPCDLTALSETVTALAQRHATSAGCRLEAELPEQTIPVRHHPFRLQRAVFSAMELILQSAEQGELVTMRLAARGPTAVIVVSGAARTEGSLSGRLAPLSAVMNELGGSVETSPADGRVSLILTFPRG